MIPKYILKEVLFYKEKYKDQVEITRLVLNKHYIEYTSDVTGNPYNYITHDKINVYELAHKCKEWLENNTHWDVMIIGYEVYLMEDIWGEGGAVTHKRFTKEKEWYLNLFKACEYILEQLERKKNETTTIH